MTTDSAYLPPLSTRAARVVKAAHQLPYQQPAHQRFITALGLLEDESWTRLQVALDRSSYLALHRAAGSFEIETPAHIVNAARFLAMGYGHEETPPSFLALAVCLTSAEGLDGADAVADAFGLSKLLNLADAWNLYYDHYILDEVPDPPLEDQLHASAAVFVTLRPSALAIYHLHVGLYIATRVAACVIIVMITHASLSGMIFALLALLTSRDIRHPGQSQGGIVSPFEPPSPWPLSWCFAAAAAATGHYLVPWVFLIEAVAVELIAVRGERKKVGQLDIDGPGVELVPRSVRHLVQVLDLVGIRERRYASLASLGIMVAGVILFGVAPVAALATIATMAAARQKRWLAILVVSLQFLLFHSTRALIVSVFCLIVATVVTELIARWEPNTLALRVPRIWAASRPRRAARRAARLLRQHRPASALQLVAPETADTDLLNLRARALLEAGFPQQARASADQLLLKVIDPDQQFTALMTMARASLRLGDFDRVAKDIGRVDVMQTRRLRPRAVLLERLTLAAEAVDYGVTQVGIDWLGAMTVDRQVRHPTRGIAARMCTDLGAVLLAMSPSFAELILGTAVVLQRDARAQQSFWYMAGRQRHRAVEVVRAGEFSAMAGHGSGASMLETIKMLGVNEGVARFWLQLGQPLSAARSLNRLSDILETKSYDYAHSALTASLQALAILNQFRHQGADRDSRSEWWHLFHITMARSLRIAAAMRQWNILAELIESARLQSAAEFNGSEGLSNTTPPFVTVSGFSALLANTTYIADESPLLVALDGVAATAASPGAWWWSSWAADEELYWTLVEPGHPARGGVIPVAAVDQILEHVRRALPIPLDGEDQYDAEDRYLDGPLMGTHASAASMASELGHLLPPALAGALRTSDQPLPIALAHDPLFSIVPWPLACIPDTGGQHLIERAELYIAPPAGLAIRAAARPEPSDPIPVGLAVLDPTGDLPAARALTSAIRNGRKLTHDDQPITKNLICDALAQTPYDRTAVFACHTAAAGKNNSVALLLSRDPDTGAIGELLDTNTLTETTMPAQVLLLACESANLRATNTGDWTTLGPAMIWAGARRVLATSFPIPDVHTFDTDLICMMEDGSPVTTALRTAQLARLQSWKQTGAEPPLTWAGHMIMGVTGHAPVTRHCQHDARFLIEFLDGCASYAAESGRQELTRKDIALCLAGWGFEEELHIGRRLLVRGFIYSVAGISWLQHRITRPTPVSQINLAPDVVDLLKAARREADAAGHSTIDVEHLLVACLDGTSPIHRAVHTLLNVAPTPERRRVITADTQDGLIRIRKEAPTVKWLSDTAITDISQALQVAPKIARDDRTQHKPKSAIQSAVQG